MVRLLHRWAGGVGGRGPGPCDHAEASRERQAAGEARGDPAARRGRSRPASSNAGRLRPAARIPASTTGGCRQSRAADAGVPQVRGRAAGARRGGGRRPRPAGSPAASAAGGAAPGQHPGGDGVVDALAGHRVDQPGGVAGQQHRAVGLVASASPTAAGGGPASRVAASRRCRAAAARAARAACPRGSARSPPARRAARRTRRWRGRRRGRRPRRTPAGGARRTRITWRAAPVRRGRGVAADRQRAAAGGAAGRARRGRPECAPSAPTTHPGRWCRRRAPPGVGAGSTAPHPAPAQHGAGGDRARRPAGRRRPRAGSTQTGPAPSAAGDRAGSPRLSSRRRSGAQPSTTSAAPTAASTSKTCGAMPSPQDLSRGKSARSSSSTRSAGRRAARRGRRRHRPARRRRPRGPSPSLARGRLIGPTPARRRRPARSPTAARNGAAPRPTRASARRAPRPATSASHRERDRSTPARPSSEHHRGQRQRGARASSRAAGGAQPVRQPADPGRGVVGEVGQHVDEVGADAEQRPGHGTTHAGAGRAPSASEVHEDGQRRRTRRRTAATTRPST